MTTNALIEMNSSVNQEFRVSEQYKRQGQVSLKEMEDDIKINKLPELTKERSLMEKDLMNKVLKFENKVDADSQRL